MYDPNNAWVYPELVKAHQANDAAVKEAYGFSDDMTEPEIVASLMKMYHGLISDKSGILLFMPPLFVEKISDDSLVIERLDQNISLWHVVSYMRRR